MRRLFFGMQSLSFGWLSNYKYEVSPEIMMRQIMRVEKLLYRDIFQHSYKGA